MRAVQHSKRSTVGGCNFCDRWITPNGGVDHEVVEMSGAGLLARICRECARELMPVLAAFSGVTMKDARRSTFDDRRPAAE